MPSQSPHARLSHVGKVADQEGSDAQTDIRITLPASRLLRLPPELRLNIWEFALSEPAPILVIARRHQPGLLQTCHQTREESVKVWIESNSFLFDVVDCDAKLISAFFKHLRALAMAVSVEIHFQLKATCQWSGRKDWANLIEWCKAVRLGGALMVVKSDELDNMGRVMAAAHSISRDHRGRSWEECEKALENLRYAMGGPEPKWLD
ncbi:hypothetical protein LTR85_005590 [Meristemomyces frigidus]|nr:hypothetical protein LTR85_005590 [Meristemomyces frigidus]